MESGDHCVLMLEKQREGGTTGTPPRSEADVRSAFSDHFVLVLNYFLALMLGIRGVTSSESRVRSPCWELKCILCFLQSLGRLRSIEMKQSFLII
jgi:hypothetical protein